MKTTLHINDSLLREVMAISGARTKTEAVELGLKEVIAAHKRKTLADLYGSQKNVTAPPRRRVK